MVLEPDKMYRPTDVAFGGTGVVFVVEQFNHRVSKWDFTPGSFDFTLDTGWGSNGDGTTGVPGQASADDDDHFNHPTGIVHNVGNNNLFVSDTLNNRIRVLNITTGFFIDSMGTPGRGNDQLYHPAHIAANNPANLLVIADSRNHRVSTYNNSTFAFIAFADSPAGGFHTPYGTKHNGVNNEFYYYDVINGKIYPYSDTDGTTVTTAAFGTPGTDPSDPSQIFYPGGAAGTTGTVGDSYVADARNNKIKQYTDSGGGRVFTDKITGEGTGDGQLYWPEYAIGFTNNVNYLIVCNTRNNRVEAYNRDTGAFQVNFGSP